jgi:site-specific recombinase XerD
MNALAVITPQDSMRPIIQLVQNGLTSANSKRAYGKALDSFLDWYTADGRTGLNKATIQNYKIVLETRGLAPSSINQQLSAIRKLASEAADNGLIDSTIAIGIGKVKGVKQAGVRAGNWLTKEQAQDLLNMPDANTLKGLRDRAILAVMLGAGLRRSEVAALAFAHIQQRDARWVIVDLIGKGNRVRTVPIPSWTKAALDWWAKRADLSTGNLFRSIHKGGYITGASMTAQAIHDVVKEYAAPLGLPLAAHDLRRTFAKLAHKGGSGLDQIQLSLGHASIKTTERYLGVQQNLHDAPCDHLGLRFA